MNDPRTIASAGDPDADAYTLLVAVGNPDHVDQLLRTAGDLAAAEDGSIHVVCVVSKDYDSPFGIFDDETIRDEFAGQRKAVLDAAMDAGEDLDVPVTGAVIVDRLVARGIVGAAKTVNADAVLVGWTGPAWRPRAVLGTSVDALLEQAPLDVYVERIGATAEAVDRVLVPAAGGPHQAIAARAGYTIASANDATLTLLTVTGPSNDDQSSGDGGESTPAKHVETARNALPADASGVESRLVEADDVVGTIVEETADHDVVVMGATRGGPLRSRLVGSIPRAVTDRTDRTVLLARRWTEPSRLIRLLGRLRRR